MRPLRVVTPAPDPAPEPSDAELVAFARTGAHDAFETLFHRHARRVNVVAFRLVGRSSEIDDLVQESFARAFANLGALSDPSAFGAWVQGIAVRIALGWIRRRRLLARLGLARDALRVDLDEVAARGSTEARVELRRVYQAIEAMPAEVRVAFVLHRVDGMPLEDVAKAMGLSLATVKRRIASGHQMLGGER